MTHKFGISDNDYILRSLTVLSKNRQHDDNGKNSIKNTISWTWNFIFEKIAKIEIKTKISFNLLMSF